MPVDPDLQAAEAAAKNIPEWGSDSSHAAGTTYKDGSEVGEHKSITMTLEIGRFTSHFA
ncbi:MAG: hypothetical protein LBL41_04850 [Bifidobacteriaceae bacterium]|jgi:hypothetical protein|nr:hypothetical protein [Bifidobacteriaceae bacterium]